MPAQISYNFPKKPGKNHKLVQLITSASSLEYAKIGENYKNLVLILSPNIKNICHLMEEIRQFTDLPIKCFTDWETLPYEQMSPHQKITSSRLSTLHQLQRIQHGLLIVTIKTLMQRICPKKFVYNNVFSIKKGVDFSCEKLQKILERTGYSRVNEIIEPGEYTKESTKINLYPIGSTKAFHINFSNEKIRDIYVFEIKNKRALKEVKEIYIRPAHEFPTNQNGITLFQQNWRATFNISKETENIYNQITNKILPSGIEYWQPLFFEKKLPTLFEYLPKETLIIKHENLENDAIQFWKDINNRYNNHKSNPMRPLLTPITLWLKPNDLFKKLNSFPQIKIYNKIISKKIKHTHLEYKTLPKLSIEIQNETPFKKLQNFIKSFKGSIIFLVQSEKKEKKIRELLNHIKIQPCLVQNFKEAIYKKISLMRGNVEQGFIDTLSNFALICENDLLEENSLQKHDNTNNHINSNPIILNLVELQPGQPVVHIEHGIGRYIGLNTLETKGNIAEYLVLSYADNAKLYVPVFSLHLITRYTGNINEFPPLHKLGNNTWVRARKKATKKIHDIATELLNTYAKRATKKGFPFKKNQKKYQLFCNSFPFETTKDQLKAIEEVVNDMCQPFSMDRLICGDVGFGKTEVAMRAAFLAVENNKQVAVLVPTTLLAQQHYDNFRDRFINWPIYIEMLSRFRNQKKQKNILKETRDGKINILIGTHKLLTKELKWNDLGLLIIDEEHRFGVRHKERIKSIRSNLDILTLSATPIPRTLNMAMNGIRDLSIIATPPAQRLAIKTFVREYNHSIIREAILREIRRGGQVYYIYNQVEHIEKTLQRLKKLVPEAKINIGHGQMPERDLERVMNDFYHKSFNVLLCTTIIETGLDVPTANTIIIERSDHLGLAQLHQLRGRVGRSHHQAYAWMLTPKKKEISKDAKHRLEIISSLEELGAGFALATHDLEIRGAGELLGKEQSGQMKILGFSLYMELLNNAINALKSGQEPSLDEIVNNQIEIEIQIPALLPKEFIPNVNTRLSLYKRIAMANHKEELQKIKNEIIDSFGQLPNAAHNLLNIAKLRLTAKFLGINKIKVNKKNGYIEFSKKNKVNLNLIMKLIKEKQNNWKLDDQRLQFICDLNDSNEQLQWIKKIIAYISKNTD